MSEMHGREVSDPCDPVDLEPHRPDNRPGLSAIDYRIGTHGEFMRRMLWNLPREGIRGEAAAPVRYPLDSFSARTTDDPSVALVDAFSVTLDVLSFYQERIANEGYILTATERASVLELARGIGYELRPGVAASANLAFTVEDADDPFRDVEVPAGTQVASVPSKPDELPQIFETVAPITARAEWNTIPARTQRPQNVAMFWDVADGENSKNGELYLLDLDSSFDLSGALPADIATITTANDKNFLPVTPGLDIGQALRDLSDDAAENPEIVVEIKALRINRVEIRGTGLNLEPGLRVLAVGAREGGDEVRTRAFRIESVSEDAAYSLTRLELVPLKAKSKPPAEVKVKFDTALLPVGKVTVAPLLFNLQTATKQVKRKTWSGPALSAMVKVQFWPRIQLMLLIKEQPPEVVAESLGKASPGFFVMRQSTGFFGNTAPRWETLAKADNTKGGTAKDPYSASWDNFSPTTLEKPRTIWETSQGGGIAGADVFLEREVPEAVPDSWTLFETPDGDARAYRIGRVLTQSRADYSLSAKVTGLVLLTPQNKDVVDADKDKSFTFRTATARLVSQPLPLGGLPVTDPVPKGAGDLMLGGFYLDLLPGSAISIMGERADAAGIVDGETLIIEDVEHVGGFTRLRFAGRTTHSYIRTSVRANANVATATHGEYGEDALGSGDASRPNQAFKLTRTPLTFIAASTDTGTRTTLVVRVDGVAWTQVEALYDAGPEDTVYVVRIDDDGTTRVVFGDGVHGKRLPTGSFNVTAGYRSGMGIAGEVSEETLTLLKTRPQGIRAVTNLSAARGAASPEKLEDARARGPQSVRMLGRIVALTDYEDFARSFAGIGKAKVTSLWRGRKQLVHLTVSPVTEGTFSGSDTTLLSLAEAIEARRDPGSALIVASHAPRYFELSAKVIYDPAHRADDVEAAVRQRLLDVFGYLARPLAEPISAAAVIAAIQGVGGVVYVDLDKLSLYGSDETPLPALATVLPARPARLAGGTDPLAIDPAELLAVIESGIELRMEADHA